jgi:CRP-like cAMP-binding protein
LSLRLWPIATTRVPPPVRYCRIVEAGELAGMSQLLHIEMHNIAPLDRTGWLASQAEDFRCWVASAAAWRTYAPGQFLYQAGDTSAGLYGLADGGLEITFPLVAQEPVTIYRAEIGFWVGDNAELAEVPRMVSLMAATKCRVLHLPSRAIRSLLAQRPEHWRAFYRLSATNVKLLASLLSEALALTVRARVCRRLLQLSNHSLEVEITQGDLARMLGLARATLRRTLADLAGLGGVDLRYRRVRVVDPTVLISYQDEQ